MELLLGDMRQKRLGWASQPHGGHKPHCKHKENIRAFSANFQEVLRSLSWQLGSLSEGARRAQTPELPFGVPRAPAPKPWVSLGTIAPELTLREEAEGPHWPAFCPLGLRLLGPTPAHRHTPCPEFSACPQSRDPSRRPMPRLTAYHLRSGLLWGLRQ